MSKKSRSSYESSPRVCYSNTKRSNRNNNNSNNSNSNDINNNSNSRGIRARFNPSIKASNGISNGNSNSHSHSHNRNNSNFSLPTQFPHRSRSTTARSITNLWHDLNSTSIPVVVDIVDSNNSSVGSSNYHEHLVLLPALADCSFVCSAPDHSIALHPPQRPYCWFWNSSASDPSSLMAISMENPQDPGSCVRQHDSTLRASKHVDVSTQLPLFHRAASSIWLFATSDKGTINARCKPNRMIMFLRNRMNARNVCFALVSLMISILTFHRLFSIYMTHRRWINAPITYMHRTCPAPAYPILQSETTTMTPANICITTLTDAKSTSAFQRFIRWRNYDGIIEMTWQNKAAYALKHGYQLYDGSELIDVTRPPAWTKVLAVQHLLEYGYYSSQDTEDSQEQQDPIHCDWVMWTDADTLFMNTNIRIEDFLPQDPTKDLIVASDNGGGYNSGVFLFRNTVWSRQFLQDWWDMRSFVRPPGMSLSGDNNAMKALLREMNPAEFQDHVLVPPRCTMNSFAKFLTLAESAAVMDKLTEQPWYMSEDYFHHGDFIAHIPGYDNKAECLRLLMQEAR